MVSPVSSTARYGSQRLPSPDLLEVARQLAAAEDADTALTRLVQGAATLAGATGAFVATLQGDALRVAVASGVPGIAAGAVLPDAEGRLATAARGGELVLLRGRHAYAAIGGDTHPGTIGERLIAAPFASSDSTPCLLLLLGGGAASLSDDDASLLEYLALVATLALRNVGVLARERQSARESRALFDIVQHLNQSLELERVVTLIAEHACDLLGGQGATVTMVEDERLHFVGTAGHARNRFHGTYALDAAFSGQAIRTRAPLRTTDLRGDPRWSATARLLEDCASNAVVAPLLVGDRAIGTVLVYGNTRRDFDAHDEELLQALASHAAVAVENARLYRAAARTARHAEILAAAGRTLATVASPKTVFDGISSVATEWLGVDGFTVLSVDAEQHLSTVSHSYGAGDALATLMPAQMWDGAILRAVDARAEVVFEDLRSLPHEELTPELRVLRETGVVATAFLPLIVEGDVRGLLVLCWSTARALDISERELVGDFASHVAIALRNAGMLGDLERRAAENARLFGAERHARAIAEAAAAIARAALASALPASTAAQILDIVDGAVPSAGMALAVALGADESLTYLAASRQLSGLRGLRVARDESAARLVAGGSTPIVPSSVSLATVREAEVVPPGAVVLPLIARGQLLGVLWSLPPAGAGPSGNDLESLSRLAAHVALAADVLLLAEEERKRRDRERMLASALATMEQPVFILGLDRRVRYANAAAVQEYRYSVEQLVTMPFDSFIASAVPARRLAGAAAASSSSVWQAEHVHRRRDGTQFPASVMLSYIRDDANTHVGQVVNVRNLTDERRIEEQLRQSEKLAALGELVAGVAHELNNPLAGISAFAQLLLEDELPPEQHESVRLIKRESDRAVGVIRDLLIFSRKAGPSNAAVELNDIVELTLRLRGYSLRSAGVDVQMELDRSIPLVRGDDQRLQQVLLNLVVNAEYALQRAPTKRLVVRTAPVSGGLVLTVADSGVGMSEETRQRIFEPFFTTKPAGQGTGLGLSVSYGIVQAHGGSITVDSRQDGGTEFRIFLPASGTGTSVPSSSHD